MDTAINTAEEKPRSLIMNFRPTENEDYTIGAFHRWHIHTEREDISLITVRKYLAVYMSKEHTIRIVDTGEPDASIDVVNTYRTIFSAMDVIGLCLIREAGYIDWIQEVDGEIIVGMTFNRHRLDYGTYKVTKGQMKKIES